MYIELTKRIHKQMSEHQFVVSIMGNFNQEFLKSLIKMTDNRLTTMDLNESIKKRIFHFVVECAQNICRSEEGVHAERNSLFLIGKRNDDYLVYLGSVFDNNASVHIQKIISEVNAMTASELKVKLYDEMIKKENHENHLLMSLLDLAKRTKERINCEEFPFDESNTFLSFKITLSNFSA